MALVQIEESELKLLRDEREAAKAAVETAKAAQQEAERKVEATEAAQKTAEQERDTAKGETAKLQETIDQGKLGETRLGTLGGGFMAKLGDFTKSRLTEQAKTLSDDEWENRLKELEETASVKRDAKPEETASGGGAGGGGAGAGAGSGGNGNGSPVFTEEELAKLSLGSNGQPSSTGGDLQDGASRRSVASGLAKAFSGKK